MHRRGSTSLQRVCATNFCMSLRGAERRGNPLLLRWGMAGSSTLGEYEKRDKFAWHYAVATADSRMLQHVIARSEATWQSVTLRQGATESSTSGEYERCCGFAQTAASLPGFPAGTRIATPVCALVRNDMQKEGRVRGCKDVWCVRCAEICRVSAVARASPHCHCEERSDVAIRSPCGRA